MKCEICGELGRFQYAPSDGHGQWLCEKHAPYDFITGEGWDGEWDDIHNYWNWVFFEIEEQFQYLYENELEYYEATH
jgi:hypothetical protein